MPEPICLKSYTDIRLDDLKEAMIIRFVALEKGMAEATRLMEIRLEAMNDIRKQLNSQADTFLQKGEYRAQHASLADKIESLTTVTATHVSRTELIALVSVISATISAAVMVLLHVMMK